MAAVAKIVDRIGWIVAAIASLFLVATIAEPLRLNWGDPWSDSNVLNSGHFFANHGWVKMAFTPVFDIEPLTPESLRYTHYPPLADNLNGLQQKIFGPADISVFRITAVALSIVSLLLFFRWVKSVWGAGAANFSLALLAGNLLWLQYADSIHHIPYYSATGFGALLCASRWLTGQQTKHLAGVGVLTFLCFLASYDFIFFLPMMTVATALMLERRFWSPANLKLFVAVVAGATAAIVVKYALVIWAVGWEHFYEDLIFQFHERATSKHASDYADGLAPITLFRLWRFFTPLFFVVVAVHVVLLATKVLGRGRAKELEAARWSASPLFVLAAGLPFMIVFSQLFCEQYHPTLLLLPYYAIGAGVILARCWESTRLRAVVVGVLVFALGWQVNEVASFPKVFLLRSDITAIRTLLNEKDQHRFVLTNGTTIAPFLYYWNRYALGVSYIAPPLVPRYVTSLQDQFGDAPVRYVHFANREKILFDKYVYGMFAHEKKWDWVSNPGPHRDEWEPIVRAQDDAMVAYVAQYGELELDTGTARIWRIDRGSVSAFLAKKMMATPTVSIDFGDPASESFKVYGFRYPERSPGSEGPGFCWTERRQPNRMVFTLKDLRHRPTGAPPRDDAALRLHLPPGRAYRIEVGFVSAVPEQVVTASMNGAAELSRIVLEKSGESHDFAIDVPAEALDASGLQTLRFDIAKVNPEGLGVAIGRFRVIPQ